MNKIISKTDEIGNDHKAKRESSTERKVYISPITRYELNRKVEEVSNMMDTGTHKQRFSMSIPQRFEPTNIYY
jgi:hypothetical protein